MARKKRWVEEFNEHKYLIVLSVIFLVVAVLVNITAGNYVDRACAKAADCSGLTSDIILDHIKPVDLTPLYIYGYGLIFLVAFIYPFFNIKKFHVVFSQFSLLILIRSFFISLTHLKAPVEGILVTVPYFYNVIIFQNDLFFSGHTAFPFLGYLLFRKIPKLGTFFLISTFVLASTVLLMHVHYSIDVFAALFITYGSYQFGEWFFKHFNHYKSI